MKRIVKGLTSIGVYVGYVLILVSVISLVYINIAPSNKALASFNPEQEDRILTQNIFNDQQKQTLSNLQKFTFTDPFTTKNTSETVVKPLQFTIPKSGVSTTGAQFILQQSGLQINTKIYEGWNADQALSQGIWRDPNLGTPDDNSKPIVLASHRWGEDSATWAWRKKNLFTDFDQLKGGETVTIVWNGQTYKYKIFFIETNTQISRLGDLIMYTCIDYKSPERIFVYANLVR